MSRMKDLHVDLMNLEASWVEFLRDLFERDGWEVLAQDVGRQDTSFPDLTLGQRGDIVAVELKLIRSPQASRTLIRNGVANLRGMLQPGGFNRGLLVIPQNLSVAARDEFETASGGAIDLWTLHELTENAKSYPRLASRLADLLRALRIGVEDVPAPASAVAILQEAGEDLPPVGEGTRLADAFSAFDPGNKNGEAKAFEQLCEDSLVLLFGTDLIGWRSQHGIEHGYQRVDLVARLQPVRSAFWQTLASDFRTRYVVFEFKNYTDKIGQEQIYSTERYLYATALRSVAIIIARNGCSESAERTIQGALREQGKLILCLDLQEFQAMLRSFDAGDDYERTLLAKRDDLLMSLSR